MRASEILRRMADLIDAKETNPATEITNRPDQANVDAPTDTAGIETQAQVNVSSMVSPLQQKLELLKKAAGIDSAFATGELSTTPDSGESGCPTCNCVPCECSSTDELAIMKQNAGLPVAVQISAEDNDIEG